MGVITHRTALAQGLTGAPAWFEDAGELAILRVAGGSGYGSAWQNGSRINDVAASPVTFPGINGLEGIAGIMNDWTGGCAYQAGKQLLLPAQGGHYGYRGNEVYALRLGQDVPAWYRLNDPTATPTLTALDHDFNTPYTGFSDGSPGTTHGWFSVFCTTAGRIVMTFFDDDPDGEYTTECFSIDVNNLGAGWTFHGRLWNPWPGPANSWFIYQSGPGAYDAVNNVIYRAAEGAVDDPAKGIAKIDVATMLAAGGQNTSTGPQTPGVTHYGNEGWGSSSTTGLGDAWSVILDDMTPPCWVCGATKSGELRLWIRDLSSPSSSWTLKTTSGSPTGFISAANAVYHKPSNSILVWGEECGATLYKLAITGSNPLTATYVWSIVSLTGTAPAADAGYNGTYGKMQMIEDMGNGQSALVLATQVGAPSYVVKLPAAGV